MDFDRDKSRYCAFFCEENIWQLSKEFSAAGRDDQKFVLFFLCAEPTGSFFAIMNQRPLGSNSVGFWDYHVVLFDAKARLIYDFDTTLGCPVSADLYFAQTFPIQDTLEAGVRALVRAIPLKEYLERFSSDRSHMLDAAGKELEPFPDWLPVIAKDPIWLKQYRSVGSIEGSQSEIVGVEEFAARLFLRQDEQD